ncbi:hypothetical protein [Lachnobacterium bovis]|uniref:hypothetical protein n=1 Tax=Lachnobacterium bovis TaxID=140626 RepID=UPI000490A40F|nr:hypothetical protein [Lachnobacterium bovis]
MPEDAFLKEPIFDGKTFWECEKEIEWVDYFGISEDMSVFKITKVEDSAIKSALKNVEMIATSVSKEMCL